MKEYKYRIILKNNKGEILTEIDTTVSAKDNVEADILIKRQYAPAKGYIYQRL